MNLDGLLINLVASAVAVILVLAVTFAVTVVRGRKDTIDTAWGLGFVVIAAVGVVVSAGEPRAWLVLTLTAIWGGRLAAHLHERNTLRGEDPRYTEMAERAGGHPHRHLLLVVFPAQGAIMLLVSLPLQAAAHLDAALGLLDVIAVLVWLIGFLFETVADAQLSRFTGNPANKGMVLDSGLWRFSRHPNYFGDACVWWGLFLFAAHHWIGLLTIVSPLVMTALLARGTGKPMTERRLMSSRPGYADYVRRTSGFVPLPPKRG
ncbi:DUF1295 domain-containing protein [Haloechinothrix halophila]|uniref:DUF1295 domain-containing protein n=1 Tax=Haloechinothrix halophila TaxID=1069073 RepID=UPI000407255F|nr:DUF1295 domain-containing protein [Haloechinothrix halophila]